jgi:hypothetical protein
MISNNYLIYTYFPSTFPQKDQSLRLKDEPVPNVKIKMWPLILSLFVALAKKNQGKNVLVEEKDKLM